MTAVTQCVLSTCGDKECYGGIIFGGVRKLQSGRGSEHCQQDRETRKNSAGGLPKSFHYKGLQITRKNTRTANCAETTSQGAMSSQTDR